MGIVDSHTCVGSVETEVVNATPLLALPVLLHSMVEPWVFGDCVHLGAV